MKQTIIIALIVLLFGITEQASAQRSHYMNPDVAWGLSAGGVHGNNIGGDSWMFQYRGYLQVNIVSPMLMGQISLGYADLKATNVYHAQTGLADVRLVFSPFVLSNLNPYLFAGVGVSKCLNTSGSDYLPMVPVGGGLQTEVSKGMLLDFNVNFNFSLSDDLDGRSRTNTNLNVLTNQKQDGFYGFTVGVVFAIGS